MAADFVAARLNMVESQVRTNDVTDVRLHDAMRAIPREALIPADKAFQAYADVDVEYAPGRFLLRPREVSKLLQAARPVEGERALAIAAPYAAAVLEAVGLDVTRFDAGDLKALPGAGYDLIVVEGAVTRAPQTWLDALAPGGRLLVIERNGPTGQAVYYVRADDGVGRRTLFDAMAPVLPGFEPKAGFAF
ncbi:MULTISPECIES: protein-L-isoaspartate O-methyltransferase [unclassified Phenylobacterium]|uniref:protein-L-isoaspartate O-methyltransferase family protein n=1 Tax=unclassified Phenylobacterium TaxID=2640670 RepID=UPI0022B4EBB4|nr:protein-L-isoaspartate O-methyltransferase [Phenylobacterium sp. NIBR 498073]MBS0488593.1 protein-L-isoaspartate O-methyltransferase [Pseudomonadota bacterium]WGU38157.1 protein-L-isoaspartate O-methyltransferase [Phenylobacterium sp. NIBR 498073]